MKSKPQLILSYILISLSLIILILSLTSTISKTNTHITGLISQSEKGGSDEEGGGSPPPPSSSLNGGSTPPPNPPPASTTTTQEESTSSKKSQKSSQQQQEQDYNKRDIGLMILPLIKQYKVTAYAEPNQDLTIYYHNNQKYIIEYRIVKYNYVTFKLRNKGYTLKIQDSIDLDLDKDTKKDLTITYDKYLPQDKLAQLKITIYPKTELIPQKSPIIVQESPKSMIYYLPLSILLLLIAFFLIQKSLHDLKKTKKKKRRK
jgi:uncharacterized membrane protein